MRPAVQSAIAGLLLTGCTSTVERMVNQTASQAPQPVYTEFRDLTEAEKKIIASGVASGLKDPESARFKWAKYPKSAESLVTYCAQVNAKNSYGGYGGFHSYIASIVIRNSKIADAVLISVETTQYGNIVEEQCKKQGLNPLLAI